MCIGTSVFCKTLSLETFLSKWKKNPVVYLQMYGVSKHLRGSIPKPIHRSGSLNQTSNKDMCCVKTVTKTILKNTQTIGNTYDDKIKQPRGEMCTYVCGYEWRKKNKNENHTQSPVSSCKSHKLHRDTLKWKVLLIRSQSSTVTYVPDVFVL